MIAVNTNESLLITQNFSRLSNLENKEHVERLSSGYRINKGADDPSGLAISSGMNAHIRGVNVAIGNIQDTINLLQTADSHMDDIQKILITMRDLSVRLASEATLHAGKDGDPANPQPGDASPALDLYAEINRLMEHLDNSFKTETVNGNPVSYKAGPMNYNTKNLFDWLGVPAGDQRSFAGAGQVTQMGPDNDTSHQVQVIFDDLASLTAGFELPYSPPNPSDINTISWYKGFAQDKITDLTDKLEMVSNTRVQVGTLVNRLNHAIDDLSADSINTSAAKSRIKDSNMAEEIVALTKSQIISQSNTVAMSQANAVPLITLGLLNGIFDGLMTGAQGILGNAA